MRFAHALALLLSSASTPAAVFEGCGTRTDLASALVSLHDYWGRSGALAPGAAESDRDADHVAVLEDRGDLIARRNPFDLAGAAVRLSPNAAGGYEAAALALPLEPPGTPLSVGDDDALALELPFAFPFYGRVYTGLFVHADGSLSFGAADTGPGERGLAGFLAGPPRLAPLLADLDPSRGGSLTAALAAARAVFLWDGVPGAGQINRNSFAVVLHADGKVDFVYGEVENREILVGATPGHTHELTPADFSEGAAGGAGAVAERFSESEKLDLVSVARRFYRNHPDLFEQLVVYTTRPLNPLPGTLAFELNVRNEVQGIGLPLFDDSAQWGSSGVLASLVYMDSIDPYLELDGFEILGHEVGHRWLARLAFRTPAGQISDALLGRGGVHWSFFLDSNASLMEGNDIDDRGGGRFETIDLARGYSALDQYAMGLRPRSDVAPFFYVEAADNFRPNRTFTASSAPEAGVSFTGRRREVRIEDVISAMGPRLPEPRAAPGLLRQAYVLVADGLAPASAARLRAIARIRERFEAYYREATDGYGIVDSTLP